MAFKQTISVLQKQKNHWNYLLNNEICTKETAETNITALDTAIEYLQMESEKPVKTIEKETVTTENNESIDINEFIRQAKAELVMKGHSEQEALEIAHRMWNVNQTWRRVK